jgi:hypothetical protein
MRPIAMLAVTAGLAVAAQAVAAQAVAHEATPAAVTFSHAREAFSPWSIDTGWLPGTGPVQVRFVGYVGGGMRCSATGAVHLGWPSPQLWASAQSDAGQLSMDMGVELQTFLRLDLQLPFNQRFTWEGPIPLFPGFDYRFAGAAPFTPFLLDGQEPRSVTVSDSIQPTELYSLSLTDAIIPLPGIEGSIDVTAGGLLDLVMQGRRLSFPQGDLTWEGQALSVQLPAGSRYETSARYDADVTYQGALDLQPAVVLHLGPLEWDLARFQIPVPLPPVNETWSFDAQTAAFDLPRLQASAGGATLYTGAGIPFGSDAARTVRLSNTGLAALTGTLRVSGEAFTLLGNGAIRLAPGESAEYELRSSGGPAVGMLTVDTSDPAGPLVVGLSASAPPPPPDPRPDPPPGPDPEDDPPLETYGCGAMAGTGPLWMLGLLAVTLRRQRRS